MTIHELIEELQKIERSHSETPAKIHVRILKSFCVRDGEEIGLEYEVEVIVPSDGLY